MPKVSEVFGGNYLKAAEIKRRTLLTIERVELEEMIGENKQKEIKPVLYFQRAKKGYVCNKTNALIIAGAYGEEMDEWKGHQVILSTHMTGMGLGVLISIPAGALPEPEPEPEEPQDDSEIPF